MLVNEGMPFGAHGSCFYFECSDWSLVFKAAWNS